LASSGNGSTGWPQASSAGRAAARSPGSIGSSWFHRVEFDLWTRRSLWAAATATARLQSLVETLAAHDLSAELPATNAGMTSFTIRAHEVLEDALRDSLSAEDDFGSGTGLASLAADVTATRELLGLLAPDLDPRAPNLAPTARDQLRAISVAIARGRREQPHRSIRTLSTRQRHELDADIGAALTTLARVPDLLRLGGS
jgi:high-affinity iron transporter